MAEIEFREIKENFAEWDKFVDSSPQQNLFSSSSWKSLVESSTSYKGHIFAFYRANQIVAGCLLFSIKKGPFKIIFQPPLTPFTTLLFEKKNTDRASKLESFQKDVIEILDEKLQSYACCFLLMSPSIKDVRPFSFNKWSSRVNYTYVVDISNTEKLWESLDKAAKYDIKKAEENSIRIEASKDSGAFYELYKKTFERQGIKKFSSKKMIDSILALKESRLYLAKKEGKALAGAIVLFDKDIAYYLLAASESSSKEKAPSLLLWSVIKDCSKTARQLDLVGANTPAIVKFKRDFAPELIPYYSVEKYNSKLAKAALSAYRAFG